MNAVTVSSLVEKMQKSGRYMPISEDEYRRLQREANERLACQEAASIKPDYKRIGMLEPEMELTWDMVWPGLSDGTKAIQELKPMHQRGYGLLFLSGAWGQGKTLAGKILTATAFRDGKTAAYANMLSVLDDIRLAFDNDDHKTTELLRRMDWWINRDVLFIDELDKVNPTSWAYERMFKLIDDRYQRAVREEALTVIAANKGDETLDGYISSRLHDARVGKVVKLAGPDARKALPEGYKF